MTARSVNIPFRMMYPNVVRMPTEFGRFFLTSNKWVECGVPVLALPAGAISDGCVSILSHKAHLYVIMQSIAKLDDGQRKVSLLVTRVSDNRLKKGFQPSRLHVFSSICNTCVYVCIEYSHSSRRGWLALVVLSTPMCDSLSVHAQNPEPVPDSRLPHAARAR